MNNQLMGTQNSATVIYNEEQGREAFSMANLVFNPSAMAAVNQLATLWSNESGMVPDHFNKKPGDLMGVIMQAGRWGLDPLAVAQSTFVIGGKIGYEAKIIQAVVMTGGGVTFESEYFGPWDSVEGNLVKKMVTKRGKGGSTYQKEEMVQNWTHQDETNVGIELTGHFPNGRSVKIRVVMSTCYPRNSTNWTYDPKQQIFYTAIKRWTRQNAPHLIAGMRDRDDMAHHQQQEKEINPVTDPAPQKTVAKKAEHSDINDLINQTNTQEQETKIESVSRDNPQPQLEDVNDLLCTDIETGEIVEQERKTGETKTMSQFDDIINMIKGIGTLTDYESIKSSCVEVVDAGELSEGETTAVKAALQSKFKSLKQDEIQNQNN